MPATAQPIPPPDSGTYALFAAELRRRLPDLRDPAAVRALRATARLAALGPLADALTAPPPDPAAAEALLRPLLDLAPADVPAWLARNADALASAFPSPTAGGGAAPQAAFARAADLPSIGKNQGNLPNLGKTEKAELPSIGKNGPDLPNLGKSPGAAANPAGNGLDALFLAELATQTAILEDGLLAAEKSCDPSLLDSLMRAAHSIKGAARIAGHADLVETAHAMEEAFTAARATRAPLSSGDADALLAQLDVLRAPLGGKASAPAATPAAPATPAAGAAPAPEAPLLVAASTLTQLANLAGENLVQARRLSGYERHAHSLHSQIADLATAIERSHDPVATQLVRELLRDATESYSRFQRHSARAEQSASRLYNLALAARMRPLSDLLRTFSRALRDLARAQGKQIRLETVGASTLVDREILQLLESPLTHLLRNACAHGVESPDARRAAGKNPVATIRIEATQRAGQLRLVFRDDGRGLDLDAIRRAVVARHHASPELAARLSPAELAEFVFLPGFTTTTAVTEISGRGVGLDAVRAAVQSVGGSAEASSEPGRGLAVTLRLPLSLAIQRGLLVRIAGAPFVLPLAHIARLRNLSPAELAAASLDDEGIPHPLLPAADLLPPVPPPAAPLPAPKTAILLRESGRAAAIAVDETLGEREFFIRPLPPECPPVEGIAAATVLDDGQPALVLSAHDLLQLALRRSGAADAPAAPAADAPLLLLADDSPTVLATLSRILRSAGYRLQTAADGAHALTLASSRPFDLVLSDVDMPRLDGLSLARRLRESPRTAGLPLILLSYKDSPADIARGLAAGATDYLPKRCLSSPPAILAAVARHLRPVRAPAPDAARGG
jgi:two-component system sensor histidine kinase and response regulator WspE